MILRPHVLFAVTFAKIRTTQRSRTAAGGVRQDCCRPGLPSPRRSGAQGPGGTRREGRRAAARPCPPEAARPGPRGAAGQEARRPGPGTSPEPSRGFITGERRSASPARPIKVRGGAAGTHTAPAAPPQPPASLPPSSRSLSSASASSSSSLLHGDARAMDAGCLRGRSLLLFLGECRRRVSPPRVGAGGRGEPLRPAPRGSRLLCPPARGRGWRGIGRC